MFSLTLCFHSKIRPSTHRLWLISSSGLTSSTLDLHKTAEIDGSANFVFGAALRLCFMKYRYSFLLHTPCEVQFDETVISLTEYSIKLYTVVDGSSPPLPPSFYCILLHDQTLHFIWLPRALPLFCHFSSYEIKSKCHVFCRSHYFVNFWLCEANKSTSQLHSFARSQIFLCPVGEDIRLLYFLAVLKLVVLTFGSAYIW